MDFDALLVRVAGLGASDVHLKLGQPPLWRIDGAIGAVEDAPLSEQDMDEIVQHVTRHAPDRYDTFMSSGELDIGYETGGLPRSA